MSGGQIAIRGFLVQTLIGLLEAVEARDDGPAWDAVTLEPNVDSEKVDVLWNYADGTSKAVQVKSTENAFKKADIQRWAADLEASQKADVYELMLAGTPASEAVARMREVGQVRIPGFKNLDLPAFREQAAHKLDGFLKAQRLATGDGDQRLMLADALSARLAALSTKGRPLTRAALVKQLRDWIESTTRAELAQSSHMVRLIRVFVSSPGDVQDERAVLDSVIASINRTEVASRRVRLELFKWEDHVVPKIGPQPQSVVDEQTPDYDIYIGIMATRFGSGGTEAEFRAALAKWEKAGTPWIAFYFHHRPQLTGDPDQARQFVKVCDFRNELESRGIVSTYTAVRGSDHGFYEKVSEHLRRMLDQLAPLQPLPVPLHSTSTAPQDPTKYLRDLLDKTAYIDIRGLHTGKGRANRFGIEELYISLTTAGPAAGAGDAKDRSRRSGKKTGRAKQTHAGGHGSLAIDAAREVPLAESLRDDRLVVVGEPGAGKTTFLRRIAYALCQTQLGDVPRAADERLGIRDRTFPILVRLNELAQHLMRCETDASTPNRVSAPNGESAAGWLPHFLGASGNDNAWGLDEAFFRHELEEGRCTILLDGLDEAPERLLRERLSRLIESLTRVYRGCRVVVSSRPAAYTGQVVLPGFAHARIDPLSESAVETFLSRWCESIYDESETAASDHCAELLASVRARAEIRRMARNPVMLTALAVVHWNERRLPEQRADLYDSIITWLSRSREQRPGRATAVRTVVLLQELALAMQNDPQGRKTQVPKRWAAERLAREFGNGEQLPKNIEQAERFLDEEEVDSGIVMGRGNELAFWHLTFQEYLAAKAIGSRLDDEQHQIVFTPADKVYSPDWREVVLLLAGTLHLQGKAKVDGLVGGMLDRLSLSPSLAEQARCAGIVGAMLRDLEPFQYQVSDPRYHALLDAVMAIFDRERSNSVPIAERIAAADALGQAGDPRLDARRADYWVTIPAGTFLMGAQSTHPDRPNYDEHAAEYEAPPHEVRLDEYRIARYPLTVGEHAKFIADDGYRDQRWWTMGGFGQFTEPEDWDTQVAYPSRPVVGVSWWEAAAYCAWAAYCTGAGVRLPTEAEWERAARGSEAEARKYPWGSQSPDESRTNYDMNIGHATPVGIYPLDQTPDGICDLGGNVLEWCWDWQGPYPEEAVSNPRGATAATGRVIRGGCWSSGAWSCRGAYRGWSVPASRSGDLGFRVAAVPSGPASQASGAWSGGPERALRSGAEPRAQEPKRKAQRRRR